MADIERRTRLARLLIAPASSVYDELKRYGAEVQASPYTAQSDELEQALAGRNDLLIDLGLASYGGSRELVGELYRKGKAPASDEVDAKYKQGLRLAVLANETIDAKGFLSRFPENVIGEAELARVLKEADWIEAETLTLFVRACRCAQNEVAGALPEAGELLGPQPYFVERGDQIHRQRSEDSFAGQRHADMQ